MGDEQLFATAWTAAGIAHATVSVSAGPGGGLLLDYVEERDGTTLTGHGVLSGDQWWWFDSYGFTPETPGTAHWREGELVLERRSDRARNLMVLSVNGGELIQTVRIATPANGPLVPLLRGSYRPREDKTDDR